MSFRINSKLIDNTTNSCNDVFRKMKDNYDTFRKEETTAATAAKTPPRTLTEEAATSTTEEAATSRSTTPLRTLTEIAEMSRPRSTTPMIIIGSGPPSPQITSKK